MAQKTFRCPACGAAVHVPELYAAKVILCTVCGASVNPRNGEAIIRNVTPVRAKSRLPIWIALVAVVGGIGIAVAFILSSSGLLTTDADWVTHTSTAGGFEVQFPSMPQDGNSTVDTPDGRQPLTMIVTTVDGVQFEAGWFDYTAEEEFGLVQTADSLGKELGKIERQQNTNVQGAPGLRMLYADDLRKSSMMLVRNGQRYHVLAMKGYGSDLQPVADRFLASFKLGNPVRPAEKKDEGPKGDPLIIKAAKEQTAPAGFEFFEEFKVEGGTPLNSAPGQPLYRVFVDGVLPRGVASNHTATSMQLKGTPLDPGEYKFTVVAEDAKGASVRHAYAMKVEKVKVSASWKEERLGTPVEGRDHTGAIELEVAPPTATTIWSISAGSLPPGMQLGGDATGCRLTGAPQRWGIFKFTVKVAIDVMGGDPATLSKEIELTVLPAQPELSKHVQGSILLIAQQGGFSERVAQTLGAQAAALPDVLGQGEVINVWSFNADGRRAFLRDDKPVGKEDQTIRNQMRALGLTDGSVSSLATALAKTGEQALDSYDTVIVLTAWNPESLGTDTAEKVVAELELLAGAGKRRIVLAMQSSADISRQQLLPESANLIFLRYVSE